MNPLEVLARAFLHAWATGWEPEGITVAERLDLFGTFLRCVRWTTNTAGERLAVLSPATSTGPVTPVCAWDGKRNVAAELAP